MAVNLCIDTNAYRKVAEGDGAVADLLQSVQTVSVPSTVLGELYAGFRQGSQYDRNRKLLERFLHGPGVEVLQVTQDVAQRYGEIVCLLRKQGTPIPTNDVWIAAAALEAGGRLLTYDSHFRHVPGIMILTP